MKLKPSEKRFNRIEDVKFMKDKRHQNLSRNLLIQKLKERTWTRDEFIAHCQERGFMKTPVDKRIVMDVLNRAHLGSKGAKEIEKAPDMNEIRSMISRKRENTTNYKQF